MKILDIVRHTSGEVGVITEGSGSFSISWFGSPSIKSAWWSPEEGLEVIDNLPNFLASNMAHPFGNNKQVPDRVYPKGITIQFESSSSGGEGVDVIDVVKDAQSKFSH